MEVQRRAGDVVAQAGAGRLAPEPNVRVRSLHGRGEDGEGTQFANQIRRWSKQLQQWDKEDKEKAEQAKK